MLARKELTEVTLPYKVVILAPLTSQFTILEAYINSNLHNVGMPQGPQGVTNCSDQNVHIIKGRRHESIAIHLKAYIN